MQHAMRLNPRPYEAIQSGRKRFEIRLYDEKRRTIALGDTLSFTRVGDSAGPLWMEVLGLRRYATFEELYRDIPPREIDCEGWSMADLLTSTYEIYSREQEAQYGALAIEIRRLPDLDHGVDLLLKQMDYTYGQGGWFRALDSAVDGLTPEQASWSPGHGVNSIWQTVNHLTFWKETCARRLNGAPLTGERINNTATFGPAEHSDDDAAWQAAVKRLCNAQAALRKAVSQLSDDALEKPLPGERTPLIDLLQALNVHDGYHLGQIVALRKLQEAWARK
jgi:ASC-1-like (ASCH) protein/uncharacterized damage-inducible protein DinB